MILRLGNEPRANLSRPLQATCRASSPGNGHILAEILHAGSKECQLYRHLPVLHATAVLATNQKGKILRLSEMGGQQEWHYRRQQRFWRRELLELQKELELVLELVLHPSAAMELGFLTPHLYRQWGCLPRLVPVVTPDLLWHMPDTPPDKRIEVSLENAWEVRAASLSRYVRYSRLAGLHLRSRWSRSCISTHLEARVSG